MGADSAFWTRHASRVLKYFFTNSGACPFPTAKVESDLDVFPDLEGINGTYPILGKLKADILRKEGVIDVFNNE